MTPVAADSPAAQALAAAAPVHAIDQLAWWGNSLTGVSGTQHRAIYKDHYLPRQRPVIAVAPSIRWA